MNEFKLALKIAKRELFNRKVFWFFFMLNLLIGLVGFSGINLLRSSVNDVLDERARVLLSSDMAITGRRMLSESEQKIADEMLKDQIIEKTTSIEAYSMGVNDQSEKRISRLLQIKAVEDLFPLVGEIKTSKGKLDSSLLQRMQKEPIAILSPEAAYQFRVKVGDKVKLGVLYFTIHSLIESDSTTSLRGVGFAPKVYIGKEQIKKTELLTYGSVATYSTFYRVKTLELEPLRKSLLGKLTDPGIKVLTPKNSSEQLNRMVNYLADYLGLIGVVALLISCVGASYLFQNYIYSKVVDIGIFKSLGVGKSTIFLSFILLLLASGFFSFLFSILLSWVFVSSINILLQEYVNFSIQTLFSLEIIGGVFSVAVLVNLSICLPVLFNLFGMDTLSLLKDKFQTKGKRALLKRLAYLPLVLVFWGLGTWQSHSFIIGGLFTISVILITLATTTFVPFLLSKVSESLSHKLLHSPFNLNIGISLRYLTRNSLTSVLILLSLTVGVGLISLIGQLDKSLKMELVDNITNRPALFMFDIQDEQHAQLTALAKEKNFPLLDPMPMVRARLTKINDKPIKRKTKKADEFDTREDDVRRRFNNRGVNLSFAAKLNSSETMVAGRPFSGTYSGEGVAEISLEQRYAKRIGAKLGDTLAFDVLGVEVLGKVISLRKVRWTSFLPNFFILFQPGVINEAPKTYIAAVDSVSKERQLEIQDQVISKFPNVSILNVSDVVKKILIIFKSMARAISVMSLSCILVGLFVLFSILQNQMRRKSKDFALQKMLGVELKDTYKIVLYEFMLLGLGALVLGQAFGVVFSLFISKFVLNTDFVVDWNFMGGLSLFYIILTYFVVRFAYSRGAKRSSKELLMEGDS